MSAISRWLLPVAFVGLTCSAAYAGIKASTGLSNSAGALGIVQSVVYHAGCTTLALCYLVLIVRSWESPCWRICVRWLIPLGRIPLTNYIAQSLIALGLFYGYGLAWMGKFPFVGLVPLAVSIILLQRIVCRRWLLYWPQGPLERLWRAFSYETFQSKPLDRGHAS